MKAFLHKLSVALLVLCLFAIDSHTQQTSSQSASVSPRETPKKDVLPLRYGLLIDNSGSMRAELDKIINVGRAVISNSKQNG